MSSLTGLASSSITSMIPGLCAAGQMKIVAMVQRSGDAFTSLPALPTITIPALTGSQIAIVYLETRTFSFAPTNSYLGSVSGTGTGVSVRASFASNGSQSAQVHDPFLNSAVCTTSSSGTVTFTTTMDQQGSLARIDVLAAVFIYTPPF